MERSLASSCAQSTHNLSNFDSFFLAHIPCTKALHAGGKPFRVIVVNSESSMFSLIAAS